MYLQCVIFNLCVFNVFGLTMPYNFKKFNSLEEQNRDTDKYKWTMLTSILKMAFYLFCYKTKCYKISLICI